MTDGTFELLERFRQEWMNGVGGLDLRTQDEREQERVYDGMSGFASELVITFRDMVEMRKTVRNKHPWWFGALLNLLLEPVEQTPDGDPISRFEVMQRFGYWHGRRFNEWACEQTGVKEKTWRQWCYVTRTYFETEQGQEFLESQDLNPDEFIENVPIGKAIRAVAKVAAGKIEPHQIEALVDPVISEPQLNHKLRISKEQDKVEEQERAERDEQWVNQDKPRTVVEWQPDSRRFVRKSYSSGGKVEKLLARLAEVDDAVDAAIQQAMIDAGYAWIEANVQYGVVVGLCDVERKVEVNG